MDEQTTQKMYRVEIDGTSRGTKIFSPEGDDISKFVKAVTIRHNAGGTPSAAIELAQTAAAIRFTEESLTSEKTAAQWPEPVAAQTRTRNDGVWTTVSLLHARSLTGGAYELRYLHTEQQVRELLARAPAANKQKKRHMDIGRAIERACAELPEGVEISISLERHAGTVTLIDSNGNEDDYLYHEGGFAGTINQAIDAAIAAQEGGAV